MSFFGGGVFGTGVRASSGFGGLIGFTTTLSMSIAVVLHGADGQLDGAADPVLVVRPVGLNERVDVRLVERKFIAALEGRDRFVVLAGLHRHDDFLSRSVAQGFDGDERRSCKLSHVHLSSP